MAGNSELARAVEIFNFETSFTVEREIYLCLIICMLGTGGLQLYLAKDGSVRFDSQPGQVKKETYLLYIFPLNFLSYQI